ncbi:hypothetical protein [Desulfoferula mesophila]
MRHASDLSLEVVVLLILGAFMLLFGVLLLAIKDGALPYTRDSAYGVFLVLVSFQTITMGKSPFGDLHRSWGLIIMGLGTGTFGMAACFIPGYLTEAIRVLVGLILSLGGPTLTVRLMASQGARKAWAGGSGMLKQLVVSCLLVYGLSFATGLITLFPGILGDGQTALLLICYGLAFFYLAWCLWRVAGIQGAHGYALPAQSAAGRSRPEAGWRAKLFAETSLPLSQAVLLMLAILLGFLGLLLFPVNLGLVAFSADGQLGLLLTLMAIQMMAMGDTPLGQYRRSWLMIALGLLLAGLGIFSSIVPGVVTVLVTVLLGPLNILGGAILLAKRFAPRLRKTACDPADQAAVPPVVKKLAATQTALNLAAILFGISMLLPGLLPGLLVAGILVVNGVLLLVLTSLLGEINALLGGQATEQGAAP